MKVIAKLVFGTRRLPIDPPGFWTPEAVVDAANVTRSEVGLELKGWLTASVCATAPLNAYGGGTDWKGKKI